MAAGSLIHLLAHLFIDWLTFWLTALLFIFHDLTSSISITLADFLSIQVGHILSLAKSTFLIRDRRSPLGLDVSVTKQFLAYFNESIFCNHDWKDAYRIFPAQVGEFHNFLCLHCPSKGPLCWVLFTIFIFLLRPSYCNDQYISNIYFPFFIN